MNRRQFIKWSSLSVGAMVGSAAIIQAFQDEQLERFVDGETQYLSAEHKVILLALAPVLLGEIRWRLWEENATVGEYLNGFDSVLGNLSNSTRKEILSLLDVLYSRLGKLLLARIWSSWQSANNRTIEQFLHDWRASFLTSLNQAYLGLLQLSMSVFYAMPFSWQTCGYPGPPF